MDAELLYERRASARSPRVTASCRQVIYLTSRLSWRRVTRILNPDVTRRTVIFAGWQRAVDGRSAIAGGRTCLVTNDLEVHTK